MQITGSLYRCRPLLRRYMALLRIYRALLRKYRALLCGDIRLSNADNGLFVQMQTSFAEIYGSFTDI